MYSIELFADISQRLNLLSYFGVNTHYMTVVETSPICEAAAGTLRKGPDGRGILPGLGSVSREWVTIPGQHLVFAASGAKFSWRSQPNMAPLFASLTALFSAVCSDYHGSMCSSPFSLQFSSFSTASYSEALRSLKLVMSRRMYSLYSGCMFSYRQSGLHGKTLRLGAYWWTSSSHICETVYPDACDSGFRGSTELDSGEAGIAAEILSKIPPNWPRHSDYSSIITVFRPKAARQLHQQLVPRGIRIPVTVSKNDKESLPSK